MQNNIDQSHQAPQKDMCNYSEITLSSSDILHYLENLTETNKQRGIESSNSLS